MMRKQFIRQLKTNYVCPPIVVSNIIGIATVISNGIDIGTVASKGRGICIKYYRMCSGFLHFGFKRNFLSSENFADHKETNRMLSRVEAITVI